MRAHVLWGLVVVGCDGGTAEVTDGPMPPDTECDQGTWFVDNDRDGFGTGDALSDCVDQRPANTADIGGDCDDANADVNPGAVEVCNGGIDDDCDTLLDENDDSIDPASLTEYFPDGDRDGYGDDDTAGFFCLLPPDHVKRGGDCNDQDKTINPDRIETCDDIGDVNCDGVAPDDDADADTVLACEDCNDSDNTTGLPPTWYFDNDSDGFGDAEVTEVGCLASNGYVADNTDCNDFDEFIAPDMDEICNDIDDDCDENIDDADDVVVDPTVWYRDSDTDGLGDADNTLAQCAEPDGYVLDDTDCDDTTGDVGGPTAWYEDSDGDSFGDEAGLPTFNCNQPKNMVDNRDDCDDTDVAIHPNTIWYQDSDEDEWGNPNVSLTQCDQPNDYVLDNTDCNDTTHLIHPTRFDFGDSRDNDCDASVDEDVGTEQFDFENDVQPMLESECANCHTLMTSGGLSVTGAHSTIVNAASQDVPAMDLIEPGDLRNSYMWHKVEGTQLSVGGAGVQMPQGGVLPDDDRSILQTWILEGAID